MSFVHPWAFVAGVVAAFGVLALHLLSTQRPTRAVLPTARFVPETDLRAVSRTTRPTDIPLLLLRMLAVLLIGAAFAQPVLDAPGPSLRRVVALEWTTALTDPDAARAKAQQLLGDGDALVVFDTAARVLGPAELATLPAPTVRQASLSPMFVAAQDAAQRIARGADSLGLTVVSAFPANAWDAATPALRQSWPGRVDVERVAGVADTAASPAVALFSAVADNPIAAALASLPTERGSHAVRLRVGALTPADSQWAGATAGNVLLRWVEPANDSLAADGVFASNGSSAALVAPLARRAVQEGRVIARWRDGAPAVTESLMGSGCLRDVGIAVPIAGDLTLRPAFQSLLSVLVAPCGGARSTSIPDSALTQFAGGPQLASAATFVATRESSPITPWLLAIALVALALEQWLRRRAPERDA